MPGNALRSLTPEDVVEVARELDRAQHDLQHLRDKRAGFVSSLAKVEHSIAANERAVVRLQGLLMGDAA